MFKGSNCASLQPITFVPHAMRRLLSGIVLLMTINILALTISAVSASAQGIITTIAGHAETPLRLRESTGGIAVDAVGNVYIADTGNHRLLKLSPDGRVATVAGSPCKLCSPQEIMIQAGFSGDGGPAIDALLNSPTGVGVDAAGSVYIVDAGNQRIRKVNRQGVIATVAGNGLRGPLGDGGPAINASLNLASRWYPRLLSGNVAVDAAGNLYIADTGNGRIRKVTPDGMITSVAFPTDPWSVAVDKAGNLYFAETAPHAGGFVHKMTPEGVFTTVAGFRNDPVPGPYGPFGDGGVAVNAWLLFSTGVAVDAAGNVYIADSVAQRIYKVNTDGKIGTIAGSGDLVVHPPEPITGEGGYYDVSGGSSGDGGWSTNAQLNAPSGLAVDAFGSVYIADSKNNRIRKVLVAVTVSAASYSSSALASKAIATVFGDSLATATQAATVIPLPTSLAGTQVSIKDSAGQEMLAPLFYVSPTQVNYQIPAGTATGVATVTVTSGDGRSSTGIMQIRATAPSLFTLDQSGSGPAAALDSFTFTGAPFAATRPNGEPNIIALYGTGLGEDATDGGGNVSGSIEATINGLPMTVEYAGRAPGFVGLNQFNIALPVGIGPGTYTLVVSRQGVQSNAVMITIEETGAHVIYSAQATPNVFGPVCNILYYCENIVVVSGRNFSTAAMIEIRAGRDEGVVAGPLLLRIVRPDVIDFVLDSRFSPSVIYAYGGLLVSVINPGGKRSNSVKIMWGGGDHPDS